MNLQIVSCLLIVAAFALSACGGGEPSPGAQSETVASIPGNRLYTDMRLGYTIRYPETWKVNKPAPFIVQFLATQAQTGFFITPLTSPIVLPGQPLPKDRENIGVRTEVEDIEQAANAFLEDFNNSFTRFEVISNEPFDGLRRQLIRVEGESEGADIDATVLIAEGGRELIAAVGVVDSGNRGEQVIVDAMIASFKVFKDTPPDDYADSDENAAALEAGRPANGTIGWYDDIDVFSFQAESGESYEASIELVNLDDSVLTLLAPFDCVVGQNDDRDEDDRSSRVSWQANDGGMYYLAVSSSTKVRSGRPEDRSIGDYTLTVESTKDAPTDDYGNQLCSAAAIEDGDTIEGVLENSTDEDYFTFKAEAGRRYSFDIELDGLERAFLNLRGPNGGPLTTYSAPFDQGSGIVWTAPQTFAPQAFVDDPSIYYLNVAHMGFQQGVERSGGYRITIRVE